MQTVLEVAHAAHMSWRSASKAGDGLGEILSAEASTAGGVLQSFNGLVLFLLHQAHTAASPYRKYICSLPLHVPLPLLWADEDLPDSFLSDPKLMAERLVARELVATSYNVTVPVMLAKYPAVFSEEMLLEHKFVPCVCRVCVCVVCLCLYLRLYHLRMSCADKEEAIGFRV
jgi:hypothetical protein